MYRLTSALILVAVMLNVNVAFATSWMKKSLSKLESELVQKWGEPQRERLKRGLTQVAKFWRDEDGSRAVFEAFAATHFAGDQKALDEMFQRFEYLLEQYNGHMQEIGREFSQQTQLDLGPIMPYDEIFAAYDPSSHRSSDFFDNKLAFVVLLNFPLTTLKERLENGASWSRRQWAEARLAQQFSKRIPSSVNLAIARAAADADNYIAEYNIWMHHLINEKGERLFPAKMRLLSHWNLRDQIKADYDDKDNGFAKQRAVQKVMERIVTQTIPAVVVNNPSVDWNPFTNDVKNAAVKDAEVIAGQTKITNQPEANTRYEKLWGTFAAAKKADPYSPTAPTLIARRFDENREIPKERVKALLEQVLTSPLVSRTASLIEQRLGRPLEPFDIWYSGFRPKSNYSESELDQIVAKKYPNADAFKQDIPRILEKLGFGSEKSREIAANIVVDPARGSGHALGAAMRSAKSHLRTRIEKTGMNYKGYNIAVHELGHNVEQTLSLNDMDHYLLSGVPNTAFTEALAFVFQARDLELLGLMSDDPQNEALRTLNDFWGTYEIAGVALVDIEVWQWMYDHSTATPRQLKEATLQIARDVWNKYYAPVFHMNDVTLLAVYSHMIHSFLYLPDYPVGHLIAHQIEEHVKKTGPIGPEFMRMVKAGSLAPDLWMIKATGKPVGAEALLAAAANALEALAPAFGR